jgi:hypothetical protein
VLATIIWTSRAAALIASGKGLPGTTGEDLTFWDRFTFSPGAKLYVADSHARAWTPRVRNRVTEVVNYDAHHDAGYHGDKTGFLAYGAASCDDWVLAYTGDCIPVSVVYPRWRDWAMTAEPEPPVPVPRRVDDGTPDPVPFDRVFLCRSGAWVPPWADAAFYAFLAACPVKKKIHLERTARDWDGGVNATAFASIFKTVYTLKGTS